VAICLGLAAIGAIAAVESATAQDRSSDDRGRSYDSSRWRGGDSSRSERSFGGYGPGGDWGRDRSSSHGSSSSYGSSSSGSSYGSSGHSSSSSGDSSSSAMLKSGAPRVTMELPSSYADVDADRDGQIGLYEWRKAKKPLAEFAKLDLNHDGFLTPNELKAVEAMGGVSMIAATVTPAGTSPPAVTTLPTTPPTATSPMSTTPPVAAAIPSTRPPEEDAAIHEAAAKNYFDRLDANGDHLLTDDEFMKSRSVRPLFEKDGVNLKEPMTQEQFTSTYVRLMMAKRT